jgi:HEAT repeat protein
MLAMLKKALAGTRGQLRNPLMTALGQLHYRPAVEVLTPLMKSPDLRLAFAAADALGLLGAPESFDAVFARLQAPMSEDTHERWGRISFARALKGIDPKRAVEPLAKMLAEEPRHNLTQLRHYCMLLADIGDPRGVRPIADLLLADIPETRLDAITALKRMGDPAIAEMIRLLREPNLGLRSALAVVLADMGPGAAEPLIAALQDESLNVRQGACWALGQLKSDRAVVPLVEQLKHTNPTIRGAAAWALGEIKDPRAVEPLIALLADPEVAARGGAADALGVLGDARAVEPLLKIVNDADWVARKSVLIALARLRDERVLIHLNQAMDDKNPTLKTAAQYAMQLLRTNATPATVASTPGTPAVTDRGWTRLPSTPLAPERRPRRR